MKFSQKEGETWKKKNINKEGKNCPSKQVIRFRETGY